MIIIKIIFLYFIEIAHTDDFLSTGTPASLLNYHFHLFLNFFYFCPHDFEIQVFS